MARRFKRPEATAVAGKSAPLAPVQSSYSNNSLKLQSLGGGRGLRVHVASTGWEVREPLGDSFFFFFFLKLLKNKGVGDPG